MIALGIESTAHTFGVGIMTFEGEVLANERDSMTFTEGGMIPNEVAQHHEQVKTDVLVAALEKANLSMDKIDLFVYAAGPGMGPALAVGKNLAIQLAKEHSKPLIGINHCVAHLTIGDLMGKTKDPIYVYVSGVNTQIIGLAGGKMRVFGETLDVGLGNALDKFGRAAGLGFPAGPKIEELAKKGEFIELPYAVKGMDVSFAGIITKVTQLLEKGEKVEDLCHSLQETTFAMLTEVTERALAHTGKEEAVLIGGVAANKRLAEMMQQMCDERNARFYPVPLSLSGDQGAMIAWQGVLEFTAGRQDNPETADIRPYERTDDVDVTWR